MNRLALLAIGPAVGLIAACGGTPTTSNTSSSGGGAASTPASAAASFGTGSTSLGTVLTDPSGKTLYYFTPEKGGSVACTGGCATAWPPLMVSGTATAPSGASGMLGTVAVSGGMELTYNGWPLHTYSGDTAAGQTNGQGIAGKWFAATPGLTASGGGSGAGTPTPSQSNPYGGGY